jgi:hypothetical protein
MIFYFLIKMKSLGIIYFKKNLWPDLVLLFVIYLFIPPELYISSIEHFLNRDVKTFFIFCSFGFFMGIKSLSFLKEMNMKYSYEQSLPLNKIFFVAEYLFSGTLFQLPFSCFLLFSGYVVSSYLQLPLKIFLNCTLQILLMIVINNMLYVGLSWIKYPKKIVMIKRFLSDKKSKLFSSFERKEGLFFFTKVVYLYQHFFKRILIHFFISLGWMILFYYSIRSPHRLGHDLILSLNICALSLPGILFSRYYMDLCLLDDEYRLFLSSLPFRPFQLNIINLAVAMSLYAPFMIVWSYRMRWNVLTALSLTNFVIFCLIRRLFFKKYLFVLWGFVFLECFLWERFF